MRKKFKAVVIGGSAGSFPVVIKILSSLAANFPLPIFLGLHRLKHVRHGFEEALNIKSNLEVLEPLDKESIKPSKAYLAPANYHLMIDPSGYFATGTTDMVKFSRPSIDVLLETSALTYKDGLLGVLLSGANTDGAYGMKSIHDNGGYTIVQDPDEATIVTMPKSAIDITDIDEVLNTEKIIEFLKRI
jgi:two-component system chemotaxis response regulator CheB